VSDTYQPGLEDILMPQRPGIEGMVGKAGLEHFLEKRRNQSFNPGDLLVPPGLRREDFTDIPGPGQPHDPMIAHAIEGSGMAMTGGMPMAARGAVGAFGGKPPIPSRPPANQTLQTLHS